MIKRYVADHQWPLLACCLVFLSTLACRLLLNSHMNQYYDAAGYWEIGRGFFDGNINLFRGYLFPGLLGCMSVIGHTKFLWTMFSGAMTTVFFVSMIPWFFRQEKIDCFKKVLLCEGNFLLFACLYSGLFAYTLTDFYAIVLACATIILTYEALHKTSHVFLYALLAGLFAYASYNVRTIYLFLIFGMIAYVARSLLPFKKEKFPAPIGMCIGFLIAAFPQGFLNYKYYHLISIAVPTENLFGKQLLGGLQLQRYDTYVGTEISSPGMNFPDPVGQTILAAEQLTGATDFSIPEYINLFFSYPLEMIGIYARHFINMMLSIWPEQYIFEMNHFKLFFVLLSFTIIYLFVVILVTGAQQMPPPRSKLLLFLLCPAVTIVPGAVEARFGAPFYVIILAILLYGTNWPELSSILRNRKYTFLAGYLCLFAIFCSIWTAMLSSYPTEGFLIRIY